MTRADRRSEPAPPNTALKGIRVLLVEDEFLIAEEIVEILSGAGAKVIGPFSNLKKALEMANGEQIDVALLDVNLAGEPIYPAALALERRKIPFVFMTGYNRDALPIEHKASPLIRKPFHAAELLKILASLVVRPAG